MNRKTQVYDITITAMMAALVFVGTYFFKFTSLIGYTHLGDCIIILAVCLFGAKKGALAGAIGAGLSDLLSGFAIWVIPTMCIKALWALVMGLVAYKLLPKFKYNWIAGAVVGGVVHIACYTLVKVPLFGAQTAISHVPVLTAQTVWGIVAGGVLYAVFANIPAIKKVTKIID